MKTLLLIAAGVVLSPAQASQQFNIPSAPGISLAVTEVGQHRGKRPILLVHGARVSSKASFDLPVAGGSLASDLAARGFDVYTLDVRGYGASTRPAGMEVAPAASAALVRTNDAVEDIDAAVDFVRQRSGGSKVALLGWATGGQWAGHYATLHSPKLSAVVMLNSLYRGTSPHPLIGRGTGMEDKERPSAFNRAACGTYRVADAASTLGPWDRTLGDEKDTARDPAVAQAYVEAALDSDSTSRQREPRSFRSPCGAMEDSFYLATGRQLWDASLITAPVLAIAGEKDFWSRPEDMRNLQADLVHAAKVRMVLIPNGTHFLHLERPPRGRAQLIDEVDSFVPR
ncbi:Lysophospholipase, alpha-beta hydrolase superfamily [Duganella sp. CF458]|uniref:alpha/beta hydrolase n=1 Tax=Duganella sp. CF458 TaxID=1884368 RepID=UPI0008E909B5|nr:alpha/beta hydrolase [Duganella sp. CF458]SFF82075.1 Lysophospholipase, alpha-beta hydrolase superfamily [Duganella sp. CF458]